METGSGSEQGQDNGRIAGEGPDQGPGWKRVGPVGIAVLSLYVVIFTVVLGYSLTCFWVGASVDIPPDDPRPATNVLQTPADTATAVVHRNHTIVVRYLTLTPFALSYDAALLVIVALCGALGAMVHTLRSLSWYIGNRELRRSWIAKYVMQPFVGAALALIFYFVARAGFFSAQASVESTNLLGFAAMAGLVGLFSDQAVLKLKEIAETVFTKPKPGADAAPQGDNNRGHGTTSVAPGARLPDRGTTDRPISKE